VVLIKGLLFPKQRLLLRTDHHCI